MDNSTHASYQIDDRSYVAFVKREIHNILAKAGFSETRTGEIDIIVSELTSNLIKHANSGELLYRLSSEANDNKAFEIISLDNGNGTDYINRMLKDGVSTTNTLGNGLGAIQRLSDFFQIFSSSGNGTAAISKTYMKAPDTAYKAPERMQISALQVCYPGENVCGDAYEVIETKHQTRILVCDGLGHGPNAYEAAQEALKAFRETDSPSASEVLRFIHQRVKKTRGLVATAALLDYRTKSWNICGVGNISTRIYQGLEYKNYMSHNGIVGLNIPSTMNDYVYDAQRHQTIVMCSDGIRTRWDLSKYHGIMKYDPSAIAAMIYKDYTRRNDDTTVLAGKVNI